MEVSTKGTGQHTQLPLIASLSLRFAECCRIIAAVYLLMMSLGALQWMAGHASYIIGQEITALKQLKNLGNEGGNVPARDSSLEPAKSARFMRAQVEVPIIGGVVSVSVPPVGWLIFCVVTTIVVVIFVVSVWRTLITLWVTATSCVWSSFLAGLGCLLQWVWAIVATVVTVVITLLAILFVVYNIVAFIAAL